MHHFVYPWINPGGYAEQELKMSLRSLEEHVLGDYRVHIIGDCPPRLADIVYHKHDRTLTGEHPKARDAVAKLQVAIDSPLVGDDFVYMADDIALLRPFHPSDLLRPMAFAEVVDGKVPLHKLNDALVQRTITALRNAGINRTWNYETHAPRLFNKRMLQEVFDLYDPGTNGYMIPTLYFNHHYREQPPIILQKTDNLLARCTGAHGEGTFGPPLSHDAGAVKAYYLDIFKGKAWVNWNDDALSQGFVDALRTRLPRKSSHETSTNAYIAE